MKNTIDTIIHRTQGYWYKEGLAEITVGLFFVVLSVYFLVQARITAASRNPVLANVSLLAAILPVAWLFRYGLQAVKARLTYPRTGFVAAPGMQKSSRWQRYGLTAWLILVCISLIALTLRSQSTPSWTPLLIGIVAGLTVLSLSYRFRLMRFALLACALVLVGALVSFFNPGETLAAVLSSAADGACFIISGGITLVLYLHNNPAPAKADR
jgi:predicted membrane-bound dolichyl-phosphate-mannose-protein mannosyltransferase